MTSKKFDKKESDLSEIQSEQAESTPTVTEDWRPDYFPTSAKPVFKRIGILIISILFLCLFLGYCSMEENVVTTPSIEKQNLTQPEEDSESEIFD